MNLMQWETAGIIVITTGITIKLRAEVTGVSVILFKLTMMVMRRNMAMMIRMITEMEWG